MLKIRWPSGRLIFNMGIAIPGKTVFLIETAPRFLESNWNFNENTKIYIQENASENVASKMWAILFRPHI